VTLQKGAGACPIAGAYLLQGTEFAQLQGLGLANMAVQQPLKFSFAVLTAAGGTLTFGGKAANLTMTPLVSLSGGKKGKKFGPE
jgi:hypothetical protein